MPRRLAIGRGAAINIAIVVLGTIYILDPGSLPGQALRRWTGDVVARWQIARAGDELYASNLTIGDSQAPDTLVEFVDYQCSFCQAVHWELAPFIRDGRIRLIVKHFPLSRHPHAAIAARAAHCAAMLGAGVRAHIELLEDDEWEVRNDWSEFARAIGLMEGDDLATCIESSNAGDAVSADLTLARRIGVAGTPAFVINGVRYDGAKTRHDLINAIQH